MINIVRNKAKEISTMFGGVELVDRALRVMENTTTIRVNEVIMTKIDGAIESTVISIMILKMRAVADPVGWSATSMLRVCAQTQLEEKSQATAIIPINRLSFFIILESPLIDYRERRSGFPARDCVRG